MTLQQLLFDEAVDQTSLVEDCGSNDLSFALPGGEDVDLEAISAKNGALCGATLNPLRAFYCDLDPSRIAVGGGEVDLEAIASGRGSLCGSTLNPIKRIGDVENTISLGTAGVFIAKGAAKEDVPYYREYTAGVLAVLPTYHFLTELRRQLSGEVLIIDSRFSPAETKFYNEYQGWAEEDIVMEGELLLAVQTLDQWLVDELMGIVHPELNREYESTHKWSKLEERAE